MTVKASCIGHYGAGWPAHPVKWKDPKFYLL